METTNPQARTEQRDLAAVVSTVLGDLAFMVSDEEPAQLPPGAAWLQSEVSYRGPANGTLCCWCTRDFAIQLTANLLGTEPDEGDAQVGAEDALREFMNVLCGQLVTAWHGTEDIYNLSIPTVRECTNVPAPPAGDAGTCCQLSISGEPFHCTWQHQAG